MDWPVVFRTHSEIEASIVRGLLETHGIDSIPSAGPAPSTFPFSDGLVEVRVAVPPELAERMERDAEFARAYEALIPNHKRNVIELYLSAKTPAGRTAKLDKIDREIKAMLARRQRPAG